MGNFTISLSLTWANEHLNYSIRPSFSVLSPFSHSRQFSGYLKAKKLLQDGHCILGVRDLVSLCPLVLINLVVVPAFIGLVAEEVNGRILDAGNVLLRGQVLEAVGLVPASGEDVEGDLPANGVAVEKKVDKRGKVRYTEYLGDEECGDLIRGWRGERTVDLTRLK